MGRRVVVVNLFVYRGTAKLSGIAQRIPQWIGGQQRIQKAFSIVSLRVLGVDQRHHNREETRLGGIALADDVLQWISRNTVTVHENERFFGEKSLQRRWNNLSLVRMRGPILGHSPVPLREGDVVEKTLDHLLRFVKVDTVPRKKPRPAGLATLLLHKTHLV